MFVRFIGDENAVVDEGRKAPQDTALCREHVCLYRPSVCLSVRVYVSYVAIYVDQLSYSLDNRLCDIPSRR